MNLTKYQIDLLYLILKIKCYDIEKNHLKDIFLLKQKILFY